MGIQWRDDLATGIELIDDQHKELFNRLNQFLDACDSGKAKEELLGLLQFLNDYIAEHFVAEEKVQEEMGYVFRSAHRKYHQAFMKELTEFKRRFLLEGPTPALVSDINRVCVGWLLDHVSVKDKMFASLRRN